MSRYISEKLKNLVEKRAAGICEYCLISIADTYFGGEDEPERTKERKGLIEIGHFPSESAKKLLG